MLASVGFITTALFFGIFAFTFDHLALKNIRLKLTGFSFAYYSLAAAFLIWGIAAAMQDQYFLSVSVLIGNALLLIGTLCMANLLIKSNRTLLLLIGSGIGAILLLARITYFFPEPSVRDGILFFNTQTPVALLLGALIVFIWLPANVYVAKKIAHTVKQDNIASIYAWIYGVATLASLIFLSARRTVTIILSFVALGMCFVVLIVSNVGIRFIKEHNDKPRS